MAWLLTSPPSPPVNSPAPGPQPRVSSASGRQVLLTTPSKHRATSAVRTVPGTAEPEGSLRGSHPLRGGPTAGVGSPPHQVRPEEWGAFSPISA